MIFIAGIVMGIILYAAAPFLMRANGRGAAILADFAVQYLRVYAICSPVTTIVFAMDNFLKICGKINTSMFLNIFMSVLSMGLNFCFSLVLKWGHMGGGACHLYRYAYPACCLPLVPFLRGGLAA